MATLWDVVTSNSTLPVQPGTTFWDHINNQQSGGGDIIVGGVLIADHVDEILSADVDEVLSMNLLTETLTVNIVDYD